MKTTISKFWGLSAIFLFWGLSSCDKNKNKEEDDKKESIFKIMTNPNDPLLLTADPEAGKSIFVYGSRDEQGLPVAVTDFIVTDSGDTTYYTFNEDKKISTILAPNGVQFFFNWIAPQVAAVTVLADDGVTQIMTEIDFSGKTPPPSSARTVSSGISKTKRTGDARFSFSPIESFSQTSTVPGSNTTIQVSQCDEPADVSQVFISANTTSGKFLATFPAKKVSKGNWSVSIPGNVAPVTNPADICRKMDKVLSYACVATDAPGYSTMCTYLTAAVASTGIGAAIALKVLAACEIVSKGFMLYCKTMGASPDVEAPSLTTYLCESELINRDLTHDIYLTAWTPGLPTAINSPRVLISKGMPIPSFSLDLGGNTQIRTLALTPASPVQHQNYTATVDVFCLKAGSTVHLSIVGTDGYTAGNTYSISNTQGNGKYSLYVPGANTGVRDVITLKIILPDGSVITREASLVFM